MTSKLNQYHIEIPQGTRAQRPTAEEGMLRFNTTSSQVEAYYPNDNTSTWAGLGQMTLISRVKTNAAWSTLSTTWDPNVHRYNLYRIDVLCADVTASNSRLYMRLHDNDSAPETGNQYAYCQQWWAANDGFDAADANFNRSGYWPISTFRTDGYGSQANGESYHMATMFVGGGLTVNTSNNCWQMLGTYSHRSVNGDIGGVMTGDFIPTALVTGQNGQSYYNIRGVTIGTLENQVRGQNGVSTVLNVYGMHGFEEREA